MTSSRDPGARLAAYLTEGMDALPDRVVDAVLDQVHQTRQRTVIGPWRTPAMNGLLKIALPTAAVIAVVVAGVNFLPRDTGPAGPGLATAPPSASPTSAQSPEVWATPMTVAGTERGASALRLTAALPAGWKSGRYTAAVAEGPPSGAGLFVSVIDNTFSDPCLHVQRTPRIDATVAGWLTAIGDMPHVRTTNPVRTTIAGYEADLVEITIPESLPCEPDQFYLWQDSPSNYWWAAAPNETIRVWVIEVRGQPVAIAGRSFPGTTSDLDAELLGIVDSMVFEEPAAQPSASPTSP
jgi:hypothetical protein